jgi:hypothetical protein
MQSKAISHEENCNPSLSSVQETLRRQARYMFFGVSPKKDRGIEEKGPAHKACHLLAELYLLTQQQVKALQPEQPPGPEWVWHPA